MRLDSLELAKYIATCTKEKDKSSVSLFEDPDQRARGSLDLPSEVHLQEMSKWKSSSKTTDSKNNNESMKKCSAGQLEHNETRKTKKQLLVCSDTFYPLVAEVFKTEQTLHRIYNLCGDFFRGNKERAERSFTL